MFGIALVVVPLVVISVVDVVPMIFFIFGEATIAAPADTNFVNLGDADVEGILAFMLFLSIFGEEPSI